MVSRVFSLFVLTTTCALLVSTSVVSVFAQSPEAVVHPTAKRLYVAGEDIEVQVEATLPASCAASPVTVALFERGGAAKVNQPDPLFEAGRATVASDGKVHGVARVPANLPRNLRTVWPGVSGGCLGSPVVSTGPGLLFGVRDAAENPGSSSTFVIPATSLFMGRAVQVVKGTYTAFANGKRCAAVDLEDVRTKDAEGNVRIHLGAPGQPKECSTPGAAITFTTPLGEELYESRTLVPGVSQPFANLAPKAGPSSGPPAAPDAGNAGMRSMDGGSRLWVISWGAVVGGAGALAVVRRTRSRRLDRTR